MMLRDGWDQSKGGRRTGMRATRWRGLWIDLSCCVAAEASLKSELLVRHHYYYMS